jgi:hypothetical protein
MPQRPVGRAERFDHRSRHDPSRNVVDDFWKDLAELTEGNQYFPGPGLSSCWAPKLQIMLVASPRFELAELAIALDPTLHAENPRQCNATASSDSGSGGPGSPRSSGGRTWWAHFEFTRINIQLTILQKNIEDVHTVRSIRTPACPCTLIGQLLLTQRQHWIDSRSSQCWQIRGRDNHRRHRDDDDKDCRTV